MQHQNITVRLLNLAGEILGSLTVPASCRLTDLNHLRSLGAVRAELTR